MKLIKFFKLYLYPDHDDNAAIFSLHKRTLEKFVSETGFSTLSPQNIVAFIAGILKRRGSENYLGESVSMAEHMLQGATLAEKNDQREEIIAGALLHDIGHFNCMRNHVAAKRYLCATKPEYYNRLSEASVHSLQLQGGPMEADEVTAFEENPNLKQIIQVRHLDAAGKRAGMATPPFSHFAPLLQCMVDRHCGDAA